MRVSGRTGPYFEILEALSPDNPSQKIRLGIKYETFRRLANFGLRTSIGQYYNIVQSGLMDAKHAFRGLERPLMHDADMDADQTIIIYSWRPETDWEWRGDRFSGTLISAEAPESRVFVVLAREDRSEQYGVWGSIEKWNWIMEDPELKHSPVEWKIRYGRKLWSRG